MSELAIDVKNLTKDFGNLVAVDHISLQVVKGSIYGFLGSNGSGKTTTLRMLCGLLTPTEGEGVCLGYDIREQSLEIKKHVGYMPQQYSFYNGLTVFQNLRFVCDIFEMENQSQAINKVIDEFGFEKYRNTKAGNLSGGWKQRLALACCVVHEPQLLFLDEPTAGVDPKARKEFWDILHQMTVQKGTTVLVTTHYMDEAEKCSHLAYIYLGKILYDGETKDLIPESHVKTYMLQGERNQQSAVMEQLQARYPQLLVSIVNNMVRVSSRNHEALQQMLKQESKLHFQEVTPSFEEVFIGLIQ